ncbi:hypothetical protein [Spiroplasma poulsonii]|uniref:hypothetical protein n=1 Tax=Spiroplasma poulsonii TaxID=2138 RepID=UPI001F4D2A2E|nr:hypothetical protein [Spiroplasma poulsonii]UNF62292.1 hypothetical protein MNU24_02185 [Spiroplasma poulsonii]
MIILMIKLLLLMLPFQSNAPKDKISYSCKRKHTLIKINIALSKSKKPKLLHQVF